MFMSEMKNPHDTMKVIYVLITFATSFYLVFIIVTYYYLGNDVQSLSFWSLPPVRQKSAFGIGVGSFMISSLVMSHVAAKALFVRLLRNSRHLHSHTVTGWGLWTGLILLINGISFVVAVGVPVFNSLIGLAGALFASWYTYGIVECLDCMIVFCGYVWR